MYQPATKNFEDPFLDGMGAWFGSRTTSYASRYEGQSTCPAGQQVTARGSTQHAPKYIGGPTSTPWVECKPIPVVAAPAPAPAPAPIITTTISPVLQTEVSPQISPVFAQMQASPGATQAATTTQVQPGDMTANVPSAGGGADQSTAEIIEFLRAEADIDRQRREAETAQAEADRRARAAEEVAQADRQAQIDAKWRAANEESQRLYAESANRAATTQPETATAFVATPSIMPGREMVGFEEPSEIVIDRGQPQAPNWPLIIGGIVLIGGGAYFLTRKKR